MWGRAMDRCLSGFLDDLEARGLLDETLLVTCGRWGGPRGSRRSRPAGWRLATHAGAGDNAGQAPSDPSWAASGGVACFDRVGGAPVMTGEFHGYDPRVVRGVAEADRPSVSPQPRPFPNHLARPRPAAIRA